MVEKGKEKCKWVYAWQKREGRNASGSRVAGEWTWGMLAWRKDSYGEQKRLVGLCMPGGVGSG